MAEEKRIGPDGTLSNGKPETKQTNKGDHKSRTTENRTASGSNYPFPFSPATLEQFGTDETAPLWEQFAPKWTPDSSEPMHIACLREWLSTNRSVLELITEKRIPEIEDARGRYAMEMFAGIMDSSFKVVEEIIEMASQTFSRDPVLARFFGNPLSEYPIPAWEKERVDESASAEPDLCRTILEVPPAELFSEIPAEFLAQVRKHQPVRAHKESYFEDARVVDDVEKRSLEEYFSFSLPLTKYQFPLGVMVLAFWTEQFAGLANLLAAIVEQRRISKKRLKEVSTRFLEAFDYLNAAGHIAVKRKNEILDLEYLKTEPAGGVLQFEIPARFCARA